RTSALLAALINGAASHALDFDDTHTTMSGHPSVPVIPAALALAEARGASGERLLAAIVAGIELECRLGALVNPGHYAAGFHATGTLGTFGAAAACAHLLDLDLERWLHALGLAGTQAAGLKASFGSMAKPLHAGKAAHDGLLAALLAQGGFTGNPRLVETRQGFAETLRGATGTGAGRGTAARPADGGAAATTPSTWGTDAARGAAPLETLDRLRDRFLVRETLFKYHAACYLTHSAIDAARRLREERGLRPDAIEAITVEVPRSSLDVCNIESPTTGLEGKFSLRATLALGFLGDDTGALDTFSDARMRSPELVALRDRVTVAVVAQTSPTATPVTVRTTDGREHRATVDVGEPNPNLGEQGRRLTAKFHSLAAPVVGIPRAQELVSLVSEVETLPGVAPLVGLMAAERIAR
ncbi:MAG TPA: MmgE/PrpD family protein, partial [Thermoanaerobaculia bacterium]|nr:MmgE/PrpD family protein [Thermoanaerobaculia bacterium]